MNTVCYSGTKNQFDDINIGKDNNNLTTANIVYDYKTDNLTYEYNEETGDIELTITMMSEVNGLNDVFIAIYNSYGVLHYVTKQNINLSIGMNTIDLSFKCENLPDNFELKGFIWDKNMKPIISVLKAQ